MLLRHTIVIMYKKLYRKVYEGTEPQMIHGGFINSDSTISREGEFYTLSVESYMSQC